MVNARSSRPVLCAQANVFIGYESSLPRSQTRRIRTLDRGSAWCNFAWRWVPQLPTRTFVRKSSCAWTPTFAPVRMPPTATQLTQATANSTSDIVGVVAALLSNNNDISIAALIVTVLVGILTALEVYLNWHHLQWERQLERRAAANGRGS